MGLPALLLDQRDHVTVMDRMWFNHSLVSAYAGIVARYVISTGIQRKMDVVHQCLGDVAPRNITEQMLYDRRYQLSPLLCEIGDWYCESVIKYVELYMDTTEEYNNLFSL